ncbi:glutaredoxin family protein [Endozoicomonas acroporae]|uniref:glutaredoxin family protein n=1 Tax=Endozoicomonas TaxID=305899 RepID=UPI000C75DAC3|nr:MULTISPECIES: glutaredoxin family protein [Endozoicomonas]WBA79435.1 glutaredoxin family protein [Endozoicomonas sp. GU-1]WBA87079.1 glutaredoxin family protein [Endozoicomonas sp. GU-1]
MIQLTLYTTSGCHLCEQAEQMLNFLQKQQVCRWVAVEISEDDRLVDRYGVRIPVIASAEGRELGWPFTLEALNQWLITPVSG